MSISANSIFDPKDWKQNKGVGIGYCAMIFRRNFKIFPKSHVWYSLMWEPGINCSLVSVTSYSRFSSNRQVCVDSWGWCKKNSIRQRIDNMYVISAVTITNKCTIKYVSYVTSSLISVANLDLTKFERVSLLEINRYDYDMTTYGS